MGGLSIATVLKVIDIIILAGTTVSRLQKVRAKLDEYQADGKLEISEAELQALSEASDEKLAQLDLKLGDPRGDN